MPGRTSPNGGSSPARRVDLARAVDRRGLDHLERREARLLQHLQLLDVGEAPGLVDIAGVRADRDPPAHILVIVHQPHERPVEAPPGDLVGGRPVPEIGAVIDPARLEEALQRRQGVALVPVGVARPHHVAPGRIDVEGRVEGDAALAAGARDRRAIPARPARRSGRRAGPPGRSAIARRTCCSRWDKPGSRRSRSRASKWP